MTDTAQSQLSSERSEIKAGWSCKFLRDLWKQIDQGIPYHWPTGRTAQQRLRNILTELRADFFTRWPAEENRRLREELAPNLRAGGPKSLQLACWIIRDWGGIRKLGEATVRRWLAALGDFSERSIGDFVAANNADRISSWSKLLAFSDHEKHAIYDARTSVALNCALRNLGDHRQFYMPFGQNTVINDARRLLKSFPGPTRALGSPDYIELLQRVVACKLSNSILAAEMELFANAPCLARRFIAR